jgi:hypothetical protein
MNTIFNIKNLRFMKKIAVILLSLLIVCCNQGPNYVPNIVGAYSMSSQKLNTGGFDSAISKRQMKIFTDKYVMFAANTPSDSSAVYGIGEYKAERGKVIEYIFYSSGSGDKRDTFELKIDTTANGFKQVIERITVSGKTRKLTEEYDKIGKPVSSPLDGAWKQIKNIYIPKKGDSSVNNNPIEFKIYQNGCFIWGITAKDSAKNNVSYFGYGTFAMQGNNKSAEAVVNSSFISGLVGKSYALDLEFPAADSYKQTITFANGDKSVEIYQKLK